MPQAYIAPASAAVRAQLNQRNTGATVLKHGDRVSVIDMRRRYVKVRSANGLEGWVDSLDLLSPQDMQRVQRDRTAALKLPSEGKARAYEALNIHLDPNRKSPAFTQIPEGAPVDVLARKLVPKQNEPPRSTFTFEKPQPPKRRSKKERAAKNASKMPPKPAPPKPPKDWQQVWGVENDAESPEADAREEAKSNVKNQKAAILESWTLVRTQSNDVGWALTRNLMMAIPDEVAQYAGGARITSYFELGAVQDEREGTKHNWLWTTADTLDPADFDAWRVFLWNRRRHRYETSYRKREIEGFFPVHVDPPDPTRFGRTFQIITKDDDDKLRKRSYLFDGTLVHLIATEDYHQLDDRVPANVSPTNEPKTAKPSWFAREWDRLKSALHRSH